MSLRNLLARALLEGCGVTIEEVEASPRYQQVLSERQSPVTDPDLQIARRAGYADFGGLLHNVSEPQALAQAGCWRRVARSLKLKPCCRWRASY